MYTDDVISEAQRECRHVADPTFSADHLVNQLVYLTGPLSTSKVLTVPHLPAPRKESQIEIGSNTSYEELSRLLIKDG